MSRYIAVDIGGTHIRAACYPAEGLEPLHMARIRTQAPDRSASPLERLNSLVQSLWPADQEVTAISLAAPGPVNPFTGTLLEAPNIPGWVDIPLKRHLEERFNAPVLLGNDANLAALGEWMYGAGQGHHHMIYITVSTGIGGGIIVDDRLLLGEQGLAGEIGHVTVIPDGPICSCGHHGHLEALASGTSITRWVQDKLAQGAESSLPAHQPINTKMIAAAAKEGDKLSIAALERAGRFIGQAMANLLQMFNSTAIIVGGGVSQSGALLLVPMRAALDEHIMNPHYLDNLMLARAAFGDEAGLIGALALGRTLYPPQHPHE
jgi:glucokinase